MIAQECPPALRWRSAASDHVFGPSIPPARTRVSVIRHEYAESAPQGVLVCSPMPALPQPSALYLAPNKAADIQHGDAGLERGVDGRDGFRGVFIAARHAHATEPHFGNAGAVSSQSNKPHLNLPGLSARNSEQMVSEFVARRVSPM